MYSHFLQPGTLIRLVRKPTDSSEDTTTIFWCEKHSMCHYLEVDTVAIIVNGTEKSAIGNTLIHFMCQNVIYSIADYNDQRGRPLWCDIIQSMNVGEKYE